jgi:threonine dehydrogenase-like Zn-dependent dehydrogenase
MNYKVPTEVPAEQAALVEPKLCHPRRGARRYPAGVVVWWPAWGAIGLGMGWSPAKGPGKLIALDMKPKRLALPRWG